MGAAAPASTDRPSLRTDLACVAILGAIWLVMIALANPVGDFPLNDDWVYALAVKSILELGEFRMPSPASTDLFPQAYWGALFCLPFGFSFTALRISTLVLGFVGIVATYANVRQLGAGARLSLLAGALVAANPLYFALANSFMTDVPFFAVSAASLYFLLRWSLRMSGGAALLGLSLSMVAILIRQAGIVIPIGFAIAYVAQRGMRLRTIAIAGIPVLVGIALHFGFQAWLTQTGRTPFLAEPPILATASAVLGNALRVPVRIFTFVAYSGLLLLPMLAVVCIKLWEPSDALQRRTLLAAFAAAMVVSVIALITIGTPMPFVDNVLNDFGVGPLTLTDTYFARRNYPVVPWWLKSFWYLATFGAILGTALLACLVTYGLRSVRGHPRASASALAMIIIVSAGGAYTLLGSFALRFFYDRYVLFLLLTVALFAGLLAAGGSSDRWSRRSGAVLVLVLVLQAMFTVTATRDYLEWNRVRWTATSALLAEGVPRTSIDGGYEFNGWLGYDPGYQSKPGKSPYWVIDDEYIVASGPLRGYSAVRAYPFRRWLTGRDAQVLVLRRDRP